MAACPFQPPGGFCGIAVCQQHGDGGLYAAARCINGGAGRQDLADKEKSEMAVLQAYLPERMSADETLTAVKAIVAELGAAGPGDMGKVMGVVKTRLAGKADMGQVSAAVKAALAG